MSNHPDPQMTLNPLARLISQRRLEPQASGVRVAFEVTEDWLQGRTAFGGLTSALGVQAMRDLPAPLPEGSSLRALQTSFVGPLGLGRASVEAVLLRDGKSVRQVQATLHQNGQVAAVMLGLFARDRESTLVDVRLQRPPASRPAHETPQRPFVDGMSPQFLRHFDMRWDHGPLPGSGEPGMSTRIHMRLIDGDSLDDDLLTVMMADASPTPAAGQFETRAPASSVSWALELRPPTTAIDPAGWWRADNESLIAGGGYVNHTARLWTPAGELAALAYQVVAIYG